MGWGDRPLPYQVTVIQTHQAPKLFARLCSQGSVCRIPTNRRIGGSEWVDVRPPNVILPAGARATVTGLTGAAQYNGAVGHILSYDVESGRYVVELWVDEDTGEQTIKALKLKRESLLL